MSRLRSVTFLLLALLIIVFGAQQANAQIINILDESGQSQSIVQLEPGGLGTVKVILSPEDRPQLDGVTVSLVKSINGKAGDVFDTTTTYASGVATFFEVPPGDYQVKIGCDQLEIKDVNLESIGNEPTPAAGENRGGVEQINIVDVQDRSRAIMDIPIGGQASAEIVVGSKVEASVKKIEIQLVQLDNDKEKEVVAKINTDDNGVALVHQIAGGTYRVKLQCPSYKLAGIQAGGPALAGVVCPVGPANITALLNALTITAPGAVAAAPAAVGLGTAAALGAAVVVPPIAVGVPDITDGNKPPADGGEVEPPITVTPPPNTPPANTPPPPKPPAPKPKPHISGS